MTPRKLPIIALILLLGCTGGFAEDATNQAPAAAAAQPASPPVAAPAPASPPAQTVATNPPAPAAPAAVAAPAGTNAASAGDRNIRFQFDGLPYMDAVTRFAQMVNKPLVTDAKVEGTLSFNDPQPYNYPEALETLNLVLSLKGVMLVEADRYLRLVQLKEIPQMPLKIFRGLDKTGDAQPGEVVTVVLALKNLDASEVAQSITTMLSNAGSVAPLSRGRGLIITDRLVNIKRIRDLLTEVDSASPSAREMRSYTLLNASGAVLVDMINRTFGIATAPRRVEFNQQTKSYHQLPPDVNDYVTAVFDDASRTMVLFGPADRIQMAEDLIKRFDDKSGMPAGEVKIIYPQGMSAPEMARMIRQAIPSVAAEGETGPAAAMKTRLIIDNASNRLIVSAAAVSQMQEIENLVRKIDFGSDSGSTTNNHSPDLPMTRIFRCHNADPDSVVRILTETMTGPGMRGRSFKAMVDPGTRSIVLTGLQLDITRAMDVIKQLDADEPVERVFQIISLKAARPGDLVQRLRPLFQDQSRNLPDQKAPEPLIMPDDVGSRLFVTATANQLKLLQDLIQKLDSEPDTSNRQLKAINLRFSSANSIAAMITQLYGRQFRSEDPRERVVITPNADDRTILLETGPAMMARLEEAIKVLDSEPLRGVLEVRSFHLAEANAMELAQTLSRLFADDGRRKEATTIPPRFEADPASNTLIVAGTKDQFEKIEALVKDLKTTMDVATEVRTFKLNFCQPEQMVQLLETMLRDQSLSSQYRRMRNAAYGYWSPVSESSNLRIAAAPAQNAVVIQGPPEKIRIAEDLIKTLDKEKTEGSSTIRTVHLKKAQADAVAESVTRTMDARNRGGQVRRTTVTSVRGSNSVLIDGPVDEVDEVLKLIQDLDQESSGGEIEFHIYKLENGNVHEVSKILGQLIDSMMRAQTHFARAASGVPVTVAIDERSNSLIVSATPECFKVVEKLITSLDQAPHHTDRAMNLYTLINADPWELANKLEALFSNRTKDDRVEVEPDYYSSTLTVVAPRKDMAEIDELIKKLDAAAVDTSIQVRMVALDKLPASQMADMLTNIYAQMSSGGVKLVDKLPPPKEKTTLKSTPISVSSTNTAAVVNGTNQTAVTEVATNETAAPFFPEVVIAVDKTANALLLSGPAHELDRIQGIIRDLMRAAASNDTELRLYPLQEADPIVIARTLNELFRPDQNQNQGNANNGGNRGQGRRNQNQQFIGMPSARVSVVAEQRTRSIIVRAQPTDFMLLEKLIKQLDVPGQNAQLGFRLVQLENTQADKLHPLVEQMVAEMRVSRPGEPVTITRDPRGNALFIVARVALLDQLESMVTELDTPANYAEAEVLLIQLKNGEASQLAQILEGMLKPGSQGETTPMARELQEQVRRLKVQNDKGTNVVLDITKPIKIMADPLQGGQGGNNRLVLVSTPDNLKALAGVVEMMDTVPSMAHIRVFPLHYSDPSTLQRLISELYAGPNSMKLRPEDHPSVAVDERTSSLIVSGNDTAFSVVTNLLENLDKEGVSTNGLIRVVPLKHATAQTLSVALNTLFMGRYAARSPELQRNRPVIIPDPRSNSLMIAASNEDTQTINDLLGKLDREPENPAVSIKVIGLKHNDAARVATMLSGVFAAHRQSTTPPGQAVSPADQVYVQSDPMVNAIVVSASPENFEILNGLLAQIDVEPVAQEGLIQTFTLKQADAQRASSMLRSLIDQGIYRPGMTGNRRSPRDAIAITVDPRSNTLIVSASPENLMVVKELIKQIDSQDYAEAGDIKLFQLKHAKASQLASVLEQFFRSKRSGETASGGTERSLPVTVTPDDRTSTLLVTGGKETFAAIERMIAQLDAEPMVARTQFKVVPLKQATAAKLQSTLVQLFSRRPSTIRGEAPDPITVVADSWANALVVGASPEDLVMVESLVAQLDNDQTEQGIEVQVLPLVKADVRQVAQTITSLYRTGGPGTASPVTINIDERLNAIVVSAGQADIKRIAELVKKLDTDQVTQVDEIRVFPLINARAVQLASILNTILNTKPTPLTGQSPSRQALLQFISKTEDGKELLASALKEGVLITADARANSLVVSAPVEYMKLLQQLVERLDTTSPQMATIKVFALKNADARQMMAVLTSLFHLQQTTQGTGNNRTVQYNLVKESIGDPLGGDENGASAIVGSAEETALTVSVDLRSNSLLVGGSEHYVSLASEIIETLDSSPAQERKAEVYRLKNSRSVEIQNALGNFLRQDAQLVTAAVGQQAMAQEMLDRQATIVAETNSNTLLISASPRNFAQLKALVEQLDQPQRQVLIQVLLAEVTLTTGDELGVEMSYNSPGNPATKTGTDFGVADALKNFGGFGSAISGNNFNFLFRALQSEGRLRVLSRPQILTADNQLATIKVGQQVPVVTSSQVIAINGNNVNTFQYQDVGVTLTVTPRISPDGFVKMDVSPQITQLSSTTASISAGFQAPIINQRLATTAVSVQSGQSILIGGLISSTDDSNTKRMPFLGNIPLLGALFRSTVKSSTRTELLILLTPQVLINGEEPGTIRAANDVTREQLDRSSMKDSFKSDAMQRQVLEPYYPDLKTNAPAAKPDTKDDGKAGK